MMTGGAKNFGDAAQIIGSAAQDSAATESSHVDNSGNLPI
jgi:hypothetical protein